MTTPPPPAPAPGPSSSSAPGREPIVDEFTSAVARLGIRRTTEGWVGGVCDGIAWRWSIDPVVVRVAFIVLALFGGFGIAVYAAGWLLLPAPDGPSVLSRISASAGHTVALLALAGLALVVLLGGCAHSTAWRVVGADDPGWQARAAVVTQAVKETARPAYWGGIIEALPACEAACGGAQLM